MLVQPAPWTSGSSICSCIPADAPGAGELTLSLSRFAELSGFFPDVTSPNSLCDGGNFWRGADDGGNHSQKPPGQTRRSNLRGIILEFLSHAPNAVTHRRSPLAIVDLSAEIMVCSLWRCRGVFWLVWILLHCTSSRVDVVVPRACAPLGADVKQLSNRSRASSLSWRADKPLLFRRLSQCHLSNQLLSYQKLLILLQTHLRLSIHASQA
jgi:hypothetical protein